VVTEIPVSSLKTTVALEACLGRIFGRGLGETKDLCGIPFFHMGITGAMTGFTSFLDATQFPVEYPAMDVHLGQRLVFMTFEACLITNALNNIHI